MTRSPKHRANCVVPVPTTRKREALYSRIAFSALLEHIVPKAKPHALSVLVVLTPLRWGLRPAPFAQQGLTPSPEQQFVSRAHLDLQLQLALQFAIYASLVIIPTMARLALSVRLAHSVLLVLRRVLLVKTEASLPPARQCAPRVPPDS
jgi:hypothetical protein